MVCTLAVLLIKWWKRECDLQRRQLATQTITHQNRQNKKQKHSNINEWYLWLKYLTTFQLLVGINLIHVNIALLQKTWLTIYYWDRPYYISFNSGSTSLARLNFIVPLSFSCGIRIENWVSWWKNKHCHSRHFNKSNIFLFLLCNRNSFYGCLFLCLTTNFNLTI